MEIDKSHYTDQDHLTNYFIQSNLVLVTTHQMEQISSRTCQDNETDQKSGMLQAFEAT